MGSGEPAPACGKIYTSWDPTARPLLWRSFEMAPDPSSERGEAQRFLGSADKPGRDAGASTPSGSRSPPWSLDGMQSHRRAAPDRSVSLDQGIPRHQAMPRRGGGVAHGPPPMMRNRGPLPLWSHREATERDGRRKTEDARRKPVPRRGQGTRCASSGQGATELPRRLTQPDLYVPNTSRSTSETSPSVVSRRRVADRRGAGRRHRSQPPPSRASGLDRGLVAASGPWPAGPLDRSRAGDRSPAAGPARDRCRRTGSPPPPPRSPPRSAEPSR